MLLAKSLFFYLAVAGCVSSVFGYFEGDIAVTPEQQTTIEVTSNPADPFSPQNAVVRNARSLWPNGLVPYVFDVSLNSQARTVINAAMADYVGMSCIRFVQRTAEEDYVRFYRGSGCFSYIGRIGGPQDISIGGGCEQKGVVIHEIFHALGRWHEQSRPDRDMFVRILTENIQSGRESNFEITNPSFVTTQGIAYDIGSIMHYSSRAFSRNSQNTIVPINTNIQPESLGQRNGLSSSDLQHVLTLYCSDDQGQGSASWSSWSSWSQCSRTCNGGIRTRMRACTGGSTCEGSNINNQQCNTQSCPVPSSWSQWGAWGPCTTSCGGGRQRRFRSCVGGNTCVGINNQFSDCSTQSCPLSTSWGSWGSWSACSSTCQGGIRQRNRLCQNGNSCPGSSVSSQNCNSNVPCVNPTSGVWSSWTTCDAQCGGGIRYRNRICGLPNCVYQSQNCNTQDCNPEPELRGIQYRNCWYLNLRNRFDVLEGTPPDLTDYPYTRVNPVRKCALAALKEGYKIIGLARGICIASIELTDLQFQSSSQCQNGIGGHFRGWYLVDVYEVLSTKAFSDSVVQAVNATASNSTTSTGSNNNSGYKLAFSFSTIIMALLAVLLLSVTF